MQIKKKIVVFSLLFILILSFIEINSLSSFSVNTNINLSNEHLTVSLPVYISEDSDFLDYGFQGLGIESNPFIIENLLI